jgi:hypothetical protein
VQLQLDTIQKKVEPQGLRGDTGSQGPQGLRGDTAAFQGPQGLKKARRYWSRRHWSHVPQGSLRGTDCQGPSKFQRYREVKGDTGTKVPQGLRGDTGSQGPLGLKGDTEARSS